jgi:glycogen synthase
MMRPTIRVSLVVNTYNRAASLERLLRSISHLDYAPFEVVVVNGPSTDDTDAVLARYEDRVIVASCATANLSRSRNIGISRASGDVVVFIDDDALPATREWLSRLVTPFADRSGGEIGAVGGAVLHRDTEFCEFAGGSTSDYAEQVFDGSGSSAEPQPAGRWFRRTAGGNAAYLRQALVAIGGFDEHYEYYLDEADVCLRLSRAGYRTLFAAGCAIRHYPAASPHGAPFIRNRRIITRSDTYFCTKNGSDSLPVRLVRTVRTAPLKHFVREMRGLRAQGAIDRAQFVWFWASWVCGLAQGLWRGIATRRKTALLPSADTQAFHPFEARTEGRPLSIALLSRSVPPEARAGGVGRYTYDLARGLHELGHRVTIVTEGTEAVRHEALDFEVASVTPRDLAQPGLRHVPVLARNVAYAQAVLDFVRRRQADPDPFDCVHASSWGLEGLGVVQWARVPLTLLLVTPLERVMEAEGWSRTQDLAANIALDQWVVEHATRVCAPSTGVLASYAARRPDRPPVDAHVVPLGILPGNGRAAAQSHERRRLLFVGRLERRKGIQALLDVIPGLLNDHPDWVCDLVGDNAVPSAPGETFEQAFLARYRGAPWLSRVTFQGVVGDEALQGWYAGADLFVAPSLYESFGLIYLEAMQYGVPVVGCRTGGVPEVVTDGETGILVPPGDANALRAALDRLMSDEALRRRLGSNGAARVRETMSHRALATRMVAHYREILGHPGPRRAPAAAEQGEDDVLAAALRVLDAQEVTVGVGLALRATAAFEAGEEDRAADLVARALGVTPHPEYFAMAVELALAKGDRPRALAVSRDGFSVCGESGDGLLLFAAVIDGASPAEPVEGFAAWRAKEGPALGDGWFRAGLEAIRTGRDASAQVLIERALAGSAARRAKWYDEARYHLASLLKRRGDPQAALDLLAALARDGGLVRLPKPIEAAAGFHRGELELRRGDVPTACEYLKRCLELNPEHRRARELLASAASSAGRVSA